MRRALPFALALLWAAPALAHPEDTDELRRAFAAIESWRVDEAREIAERWPRMIGLLASWGLAAW